MSDGETSDDQKQSPSSLICIRSQVTRRDVLGLFERASPIAEKLASNVLFLGSIVVLVVGFASKASASPFEMSPAEFIGTLCVGTALLIAGSALRVWLKLLEEQRRTRVAEQVLEVHESTAKRIVELSKRTTKTLHDGATGDPKKIGQPSPNGGV